MALNRSGGRDVHIYDAKDPDVVLGGLILTNGVTNANFYSMIEIFLFFNQEYVLRHGDGTEVQRDEQAFRPGDYYILTNGTIIANNEPWLVRTISVASGTRVAEFREAVRQRDRRCIITGRLVLRADYDIWRGFEATHIFPIAYKGRATRLYKGHWDQYDYGRWITIQPNTGGSINSVQNGLLLGSDIHDLFDSYDISINPDDNYKIVCFGPDGYSIAGKHADIGDDESRPVDQLLRWHFRQAVLANMRGAGEPVFECDFPAGSDMVGEIMAGPRAAERMEFELFSRLAAH